MFKLVIQDDEGKTTVVPLIRDEITIGRKEGNTIRLTERNVSRRHARILRNNGEVQIEDLGSYNGIRVNNARIAERVNLRVSDQVQIGDYKLYLKAEGVEQVDDARTMPIERVDARSDSGATDVIPAVPAQAPSAPTQPMMMATPAPGTLPSAAQLIGNPNRTLVAVADTDPGGGRPVASAAQVAAVLQAPAGYGRLVVLSSNFAGKEFELSRPQMIIGRTDENDIVVNHRSISRNHAKLTRDPDTGRYTISDLQSSNGVRVNNQDYGKVELRRGDLVDLGHVRLRFVEAGEDFIFSRDAVITDVPDSKKSKTLMVVIALATLVVIGVIAFVVMKDSGKKSSTKNGNNDILATESDGGTLVALTEDAASVAPVVIDAPEVSPDDQAGRVKLQCHEAAEQKKWTDLIDCAARLKPFDKAEADKLYKRGHIEQNAEAVMRRFDTALKDHAYKTAKIELGNIPTDSVYKQQAEDKWADTSKAKIKELTSELKSRARGDCKDWNKYLNQANNSLPKEWVADAKKDAQCKVEVSTKPDKPDPCANVDDLVTKGRELVTGGSPDRGIAPLEQAYKCRQDNGTFNLLVMAVCKSSNPAKAKSLYKSITNKVHKERMYGFCANSGVVLD